MTSPGVPSAVGSAGRENDSGPLLVDCRVDAKGPGFESASMTRIPVRTPLQDDLADPEDPLTVSLNAPRRHRAPGPTTGVSAATKATPTDSPQARPADAACPLKANERRRSPYKRGVTGSNPVAPTPGQSGAGGLPDVLAPGEHWLAGEWSEAGLRCSPGSATVSCRSTPPMCRLWERKWELVSGKALAAGGARRVFGLVNGVTGTQAVGAQMGAQSGRALSHEVLKGPAARLQAGLPSPVKAGQAHGFNGLA
jgi:hypothetical protein